MENIHFGIPIRSWLIALTVLVTSFFVLLASLSLVRSRVKTISESTVTLVDDFVYDLLRGTKRYFLLAISVYLASLALPAPPNASDALRKGVFLVFLFQFSAWGNSAIRFWIENYLRKRSLSDPSIATSIGLIGFTAKFALISLIALMALHNFGFDITTLIAGLGVGGIAVALAVQNILGDLFASLTIVLDKPFVVGDFIVVGDFMGTIEHIGLKTTRIRSLSGEQLVFSNGDLLQSRVRNFKRMSERRVAFTLGVVYQTPAEKLEKIPQLIRSIVEKIETVRFERCHFLKFGDSSLQFEIVYWVKDPDFGVHADLAQKINLEIFKALGNERIEFAYPSQTLFLQRGLPALSAH